MIVISGASGFVGRRLCRAITEQYAHSRHVCYAKTTSSAFDEEGRQLLERSGINLREADFTTGEGLIPLRQMPRTVFHLAANSATFQSDHRSNDIGTQNFIRSLRGLRPGSHVLFASSIAVADTRNAYTTPITESTVQQGPPLTEYGRAKLRAEDWLRNEAKKVGFAVTVIRFVTIYGSGARKTTLFPVLKRLCAKNHFLTRIPWPGLTGLIHVDDAVQILLSLGELSPPAGHFRLYYAQGEVFSIAQLSALIHARFGNFYKPLSIPAIAFKLFNRCLWLGLHNGGLLPSALHGALWRLHLLTDNVFWSDCSLLRQTLNGWIPKNLNNHIAEVLT